MADQATDIRGVLDPLTVDKAIKRQTWDAFYGATDPADFKKRFDSLTIPNEVKARLWDIRFAGSDAPPRPPAPMPSAAELARTPGVREIGGKLPPLPSLNMPGLTPDAPRVKPKVQAAAPAPRAAAPPAAPPAARAAAPKLPPLPPPINDGSPQILAEEPPHAPPMIDTRAVRTLSPAAKATVREGPEAPPATLWEALNTRPDFVTGLLEELDPLMVGPFQIQQGILEAASGLTTPMGAGVVAGIGLTSGLIEASTSPAIQQGWAVANAALSAYFTGSSGKALYDSGKRGWQNIQQGNWEGAAKELGVGSVDALFTILGAVGFSQSLQQATGIGRLGRELQENANLREAQRRWQERKDARAEQAARPRIGSAEGEPPAGPGPSATPPPAASEPPSTPPTPPIAPAAPSGAPAQALEPHIRAWMDAVDRLHAAPRTGKTQAEARDLVDAGMSIEVPEEFNDKLGEYFGKIEDILTASSGTIPAEVEEAPSGNEPSAPSEAPELPPGVEPLVTPGGASVPGEVSGPRQPSGEIRRGLPSEVTIPGGEEVLDSRYELWELRDIFPSHEGITFNSVPEYQHKNDRDYQRNKNLQALVIARAKAFKPANLITDNPDATNGPPILDANGNVLGGNSRTQILQRIHAMHPEHVDAYRAKLATDLRHYGIEPGELAAFEQPVLVRILTGQYDPQNTITDLNRDVAAALSPSEQALADSHRVSENTLDWFVGRLEEIGKDATILKAIEGEDGVKLLQLLVEDGILTEQEIGGFIERRATGEDVVTAAGKDRIAKLLLGRLFRTPDQMERQPAAILSKLERILPSVARWQGRGEWDISEKLQAALDIIEEAQARGIKNVQDLEKQVGMFGQTQYDPQALTLAQFIMSSGPNQVTKGFRQYVHEMSLEGGLLGPKDQADAFAASFGGPPSPPPDEGGGSPPAGDGPAPVPVPEEGAPPAEEPPKEGVVSRGTADMIGEIGSMIRQGIAIPDNPALTKIADRLFGGSIAQGTYTSADMYDALEAGVNAWVAMHGKALLDKPAEAEALAELRTLMGRLPTHTARTEEKKELQQFSTPPTIAFVVAKLAALESSDIVMEPSAGTGSLAVWPKAMGLAVQTNEIAPRRASILRYLGFDPTSIDAESLHDLLAAQRPTDPRPTVILMNPPFSATGGRVKNHDIKFGLEHINQALQHLQDGGRLVAIMGRGAGFEHQKPQDWWKRIADRYNVRANMGLPGEEYAKYGTSFENQLIVIDKTGPTPGSTWTEKLSNIRWGQSESLEEALNALRGIVQDRPPVRPGVSAPPSQRPVASGAGNGGAGGGGTPSRPGGGASGGAGQRRPSGGAPGALQPGAGPGVAPQPQSGVGPGAPGLSGPVASIPGGPQNVGGGGVPGSGGPAGGGGQPPILPSGDQPPGDLVPPVEEQVAPIPEPETRVPEVADDKGLYETYVPQHVTHKVPHPAKIVESAVLAAVESPPITYSAKLPERTMANLSGIQLEPVLYAGQRHAMMLPNGERAGYFIGDGTGVGKGREIAAIIYDNFMQGRKRAVWISASKDLRADAARDLGNIGADEIVKKSQDKNGENVYTPVNFSWLNKLKQDKPIEQKQGAIFLTYATLRNKPRQKQLLDWQPDVIIFDEVHAAKNLAPKQGKPTQQGLAVLNIQKEHPNARVVYVSATGATEPENMAYMTRLGLWGPGSQFLEFPQFLNQVGSSGVGALEMVARDMKAMGMYASRLLTFGPDPERGIDAVEYREIVHETALVPQQREMYDAGAAAYRAIWKDINVALGITNSDAWTRRNAKSQFWGGLQRFFDSVIMSLKAPTVIAQIQRALDDNHSVVLDVRTTGEAQQERTIDRADEMGSDLEDLDFSPKESIRQMVNNVFPIYKYKDVTDPATGKTVKVQEMDADGNPVESQEAKAMRQAILDRLEILQLPESPLDQIINKFRPENVAEITGRSRRIIVDPETGRREIQTTIPPGATGQTKNIEEMRLFNSGQKRIAIISPAGGTGISLHADRGVKNQQKREQFLWQLEWSADKAMQKLGRTHRSNQVTAPLYLLISSDIGGEKRFSSAIARRLESLGAFTKGDRNATGGGDLAKYNFMGAYGDAAVATLIRSLNNSEVLPGMEHDPRETIWDMGWGDRERGQLPDPRSIDVSDFFNRMMALEIGRQGPLFANFVRQFEAVVRHAKETGAFDEGVTDIRGTNVHLAKPLLKVHTDPTTKAVTAYAQIDYETPTETVSFERVARWFEAVAQNPAKERLIDGFYRQSRSGNIIYAKYAHDASDGQSGAVRQRYKIFRPGGEASGLQDRSYIQEKFESVTPQQAQTWWQQTFLEAPKTSKHSAHIITGAVLPVWRDLQAARGARGLKVVRVNTTNSGRILGVQIPQNHVGQVLSELGIGRDLRTPDEIFRSVFEEGTTVELAGNMKLQRIKFRAEPAIRLVVTDSFKFRELRLMGLVNEEVQFQQVFLVPTNPEKGIEVLGTLLNKYPAIQSRSSGPEAGSVTLDFLGTTVLQTLWDDTVAPTLQAAGISTVDFLRGARHLLAPRAGVPEGNLAMLMKMKGEVDRANFVLEQAMEGVKRMFDHMPESDLVDFLDRLKTGQAQRTVDLEQVAQFYRDMGDAEYNAIIQFNPTLNYKEDHFRILWKVIPGQPQAKGFMGIGRRPLRGTRGFLKHATLKDLSDGIAIGGVPYSYNPQVMFERTHADVLKYVAAQKMWKGLKDRGLRRFVRFSDTPPAGYDKIADSIAKVYFPVPQGLVHAGEWWVESNIARLLNNYLSHDYLRDKFIPSTATGAVQDVARITQPVGRSLLWFKNFTTAIELSISPFHLVFETIEAMANEIGIGGLKIWNQGVLRGDPAKLLEGIRQISLAPIAPFTAARLGGSAIQSVWASETPALLQPTPGKLRAYQRGISFATSNPEMLQRTRELFNAGLKLEMSPDYRNGSIRAIRESLNRNNYIRAFFHLLPAANEWLMTPLFQVYIPRLKVGFALREYAQQYEQYAAELAGGTVTKERLARQAVDNVESRFGEMNFDNLFWNRTLKTFFQILFRSVTWKLGNIRGFSTAFKGQAKMFDDPLKVVWEKITGAPAQTLRTSGGMRGLPELDPSFSWLIGLCATTAVVGSLVAKIFSGKFPWEWAGEDGGSIVKETLHPRIGGSDDRGKPDRVNTATYLKDAEHLLHSPSAYFKSSMSGMATRVPEIWDNEDFYGNYIFDPEDTALNQIMAVVTFAVGKPFTIANFERSEQMGASATQTTLGYFGFPRASRELDRTPAEKVAIELRMKRGRSPLTASQMLKSEKARHLGRLMRDNQDAAVPAIAEALEKGQITMNQVRTIKEMMEGTYLQRLVKPMPLEDALDVWDAATPAEREAIARVVFDKSGLLKNVTPDRRPIVQQRLERAVEQARGITQ